MSVSSATGDDTGDYACVARPGTASPQGRSRSVHTATLQAAMNPDDESGFRSATDSLNSRGEKRKVVRRPIRVRSLSVGRTLVAAAQFVGKKNTPPHSNVAMIAGQIESRQRADDTAKNLRAQPLEGGSGGRPRPNSARAASSSSAGINRASSPVSVTLPNTPVGVPRANDACFFDDDMHRWYAESTRQANLQINAGSTFDISTPDTSPADAPVFSGMPADPFLQMPLLIMTICRTAGSAQLRFARCRQMHEKMELMTQEVSR